jgi:hypothetical protein
VTCIWDGLGSIIFREIQRVIDSAITATPQRPYCESDSLATDEGIICFYYELKSLLPSLQQLTTGSYPEPHEFNSIQFNSSKLPLKSFIILSYACLGILKDIKNLYAFLIYPVRSTCTAHPTILYLITLIVSGEKNSHEAAHFTLSAVVPHRACHCTRRPLWNTSNLHSFGVTDQVSYSLSRVWLRHVTEAVSGLY